MGNSSSNMDATRKTCSAIDAVNPASKPALKKIALNFISQLVMIASEMHKIDQSRIGIFHDCFF